MSEDDEKNKRAKNFMYAQQVRHLKEKPENFESFLKDSSADKWAYILHDKDKGKKLHYHIILHYDNGSRVGTVANIFSDKPQYVKVWDKRWETACAYIIHLTEKARREDKHLYDPHEVKANFNFVALIEKIKEKYKRKNKNLKGKKVSEAINQFADRQIDFDELGKEIGVQKVAKNKV